MDPSSSHAPRLVLVADDSVAVRRLISARLRAEGYEVREAEDGFEAFAKAAERRPDVLVTDDVLPCLSGAELVAAVRDVISPRLPIVFLCDYPAGIRRAELAGLPPEAVVRKPFDLDELARRVRGLAG